MKIKVCGMKDPENIKKLMRLPIDMIGLIFYKKSPRYVNEQNAADIKFLSNITTFVGVFVDATEVYILDKVEKFGLKLVQLHGNESPEFCRSLRDKGIPVIKAFQIKTVDDFKTCLFYEDGCDYFLFDTSTPQYGGSGKKFDWELLPAYTGSKPTILSGGIAPEDAGRIKLLDHPRLSAIDINSRFEVSPGVKDINLIRRFWLEI